MSHLISNRHIKITILYIRHIYESMLFQNLQIELKFNCDGIVTSYTDVRN